MYYIYSQTILDYTHFQKLLFENKHLVSNYLIFKPTHFFLYETLHPPIELSQYYCILKLIYNSIDFT